MHRPAVLHGGRSRPAPAAEEHILDGVAEGPGGTPRGDLHHVDLLARQPTAAGPAVQDVDRTIVVGVLGRKIGRPAAVEVPARKARSPPRRAQPRSVTTGRPTVSKVLYSTR